MDRRWAGGDRSFGLMDLVGLDIAVASTGTVKDNVTDPEKKLIPCRNSI